MIKDFIIPLHKDELLTSHAQQYYVEKIIPPGMVMKALEESRVDLQRHGASFILNCFDTFFAVLVHGTKIEIQLILVSFRRIFKGIQLLVADMETIFDKNKEIEEEERLKLLCINKMLAYLVSQLICHINERLIKNSQNEQTYRKKNTKTVEEDKWDDERDKILELIYRWVQLPLQKIWKHSIVEDSFVTVMSQICYNVLEHCKDAKQKYSRQTIFEILGTLIKKYNHGIICIVRIVQLVKLCDTLPTFMANGVVHMDVQCGCNGLVKQVIKEISQSEPAEVECRNISTFLENIATSKPDIMLPVIDDILEYLTSEYYIMRNCAIGIIGTVVLKVLTNDDLDQKQKEQRDECLHCLFEHLLDYNSYVRSKVLHVWQNLSNEGAIPLAIQGKLLSGCISRLKDKSANVRKQALQLLRALLQGNPFAAKLEEKELLTSMEKEKIKLKELQVKFTNDSGRGDTARLELWNTLLPDIKKSIKKIIKSHNKDNDEDNDEENDEENDEDNDEENDEDNDEENDEDNDDNEEKTNDDIDSNLAFEKIRKLMLNEQVFEAVSYLWTICKKLQDTPKIEKLSLEAKEECLFAFLFKIFMESEDRMNEQCISQEQKKLREEIKAQKRLVNYLENSLEFAKKLKDALPAVEELLFSTTSSDAIEACALFGKACQFGVTGVSATVCKALFQVLHNDQSVRLNLAAVYKEVYLHTSEPQKSSRQAAITRVNSLINLVKKLQPGQGTALEELIKIWYTNKEIDEEVLQVLWEIFSMKLPGTNLIEGRAALILIMMIGEIESKIIIENLDVLVKMGLGPREKSDLLLARDTCRTLNKIKQENTNIETIPIRYQNNHEMFAAIITLLRENIFNSKEIGYISFATDAINVIYKLANQPHHLIKNFLLDILKAEQFNAADDNTIVLSSIALSNLLHIVGHIAIREMVHLDIETYKELKRRTNLRYLKKHNLNKENSKYNELMQESVSSVISSANNSRSLRNKENLQEDNGADALEGAADDADAEFINAALESEIVTGNGLLTKFVPIVLDVCQHPEKYRDENLQAAGTLALCKMMTVSSMFCEAYLQLLVTILERSPYPGIRANVLLGLSDLTIRFPNQVEPWTKHIYGRLQDKNRHVRSICVQVLSNLIMKQMVRVKGQVSQLALCIIDEDVQIQHDTKIFFKELSQRDNALYNVVPDILSRLSDPQLNLSEEHFQEIIGYILGLVQHKRQIDTIVDKICARFKLAVTERQWRDLSYCLSVLQFSVKGLQSLIESLPLLKEKIHHKPVLKTLQGIIDQSKKKSDTKAASVELENKIKELLEGFENTEPSDNVLMPPPTTSIKRNCHKEKLKDNDKEENYSDTDPGSSAIKKKNTRFINKKTCIFEDNSDSSSSESDDENVQPKPTPNKRNTRVRNNRKVMDSDSLSPPLPKRNKNNKTEMSAKTPAKTPAKTSAKTPAKTPARTPARTSARTPARTPAKTPTQMTAQSSSTRSLRLRK